MLRKNLSKMQVLLMALMISVWGYTWMINYPVLWRLNRGERLNLSSISALIT